MTPSQFSRSKNEYFKKQIYNKTNKERLNELILYGKNLLLSNIKYKDINANIYKNVRIYATDKFISLLNSKDIGQYFIDTTYICLPYDIEDQMQKAY